MTVLLVSMSTFENCSILQLIHKVFTQDDISHLIKHDNSLITYTFISMMTMHSGPNCALVTTTGLLVCISKSKFCFIIIYSNFGFCCFIKNIIIYETQVI